jgi:ubiquinone/menaquinone biosynthesis C-methylase UbiE
MAWLMAAMYERVMGATEVACLHDWRAELLGDLRGDVLELGAGTGYNLAHYPATVDRLILTEPDEHMRARLADRLRDYPGRATVTASTVEQLPDLDDSYDAVVATLLLCSVADPQHALAEIHRVLRPGGRYVFIEHVGAEPGTSRRRWQRVIEPAWKRVAGNCHVTRDTAGAIERAGFDLVRLERASMRKALPWVRPSIRGAARKPARPPAA